MSSLDPVPMSSLLISDAPIELQDEAGDDVSTGDMRIAHEAGRLGEGAQDDQGQFKSLHESLISLARRIKEVLLQDEQRRRSTDLSLNRLKKRLDMDMAIAEEKGSFHRTFLARDAFVSIMPKLGELLEEEYNLKTSVKERISYLTQELEFAQAALCKVAEVPRDQLDKHVHLWARNVREASYDMEDVLDTFHVRVKGHDFNDEEKQIFLKKHVKEITKIVKKISGDVKNIMTHLNEVTEQCRKVREASFQHIRSTRTDGFLVRSPASDVLYDNLPWATRLEIIRGISSALAHLHSSGGRYPIVYGDIKPANILLGSTMVPKIGDFGMPRVLHADDPIPAVPLHTAPPDAKFSGNPSAKRDTLIKISSHTTHGQRYWSVHRHPLIQMLPPARKWTDYVLTSCARLITSKMIGEEGWISAKPKYETPNAGHVSKYNMIRKLFGLRNGLAVNESQQRSDPGSRQANDRKMAVNTKTSAPWIVATAAPHHATGDRSLLSGFIMEFEDQFIHAVNRVPMKVLARGAVVTDTLVLPDVWFVPGLKENLVSVSQLAELDHNIGFGRGECCISSARDAKIVGKGRLQKGGHYVLDYLKVPLAI